MSQKRRERQSAAVEEAHLEQQEFEDAQRRRAPRVAVVYETIRLEGEHELSRPPLTLAWSGLAAGLSMGFSFLARSLLAAYLPAAGWTPVVADLGYSVGFIIVILGRQQLFTENTLTPVLALLRRRRLATLLGLVRLWAIVLVANTVGAFLFAVILAKTPLLGPHVHKLLSAIGTDPFSSSFAAECMRGVFAGWLIASLIWLMPFAETSRVFVIIIITYVIALGRFSHIIASSVEAFYVVLTGQASWTGFFLGFYVPTLIGNVIGGVPLVALINYAQVPFIRKEVIDP